MKDKILRWSIYLIGIGCLYVFISIRSLPVMNTLIKDKMDPESQDFNEYGDLYYFGCISSFKENYPKKVENFRFSDKHTPLKQAEILTFGDSFFAFSFHVTIPERISDSLNKKVYSYITFDPTQANPFCVLGNGGFQKEINPKFLIYETIERNIPARFSSPYPIACPTEEKTLSKKITGFIDKYIFKKSSEPLYSVLLKNSYFSKRAYSDISTFKFNTYGYITASTPIYKTGKQPWLFYEKELGNNPGSFYHVCTDEEIKTYCDNIQLLATNLKEQYNLNLVFLPIPNKYSIYHTQVNNDKYNDFLPRLYQELQNRNITYVDLYNPYKASSDILYWGTDTHWNKKGVDIALNKTIEKLTQ
jgi:hypothetical protein